MPAKAQIDIQLSSGAKAGQTLKELRQTANRLNKEINNLKPGSEEFIKKTKDYQKVTGRLKDVRTEVKGVDKQQGLLNSRFAQMLPFSGKIQQMAGGFNAVKGAVGGTTTGMKALKIAIASTGIGLLVLAFGALVTWMRSTQAGMDKITAAMRPLSALFQRIIGLVQDFGGTVAKAFKGIVKIVKDPIQAIKDLGAAIEKNIINRFEALGKFGPAIAKIFSGELIDGFKDLGNATVQLGLGIENSIDKIGNAAKATKNWIKEGLDAGTRIDQLQKQIEKTDNELTVARATLNAEYQKSKELAQDLSKTDDERLAAAKAAQAAQNELLNIEQNFIDLKIAKMKEEHALNDTSRADKKELAQLEAERINFEAQAARKRASAKALENTVDREIAAEKKKLNKEIADENKKTEKEAADQREENLQKEIEARTAMQDLVIEAMAIGLEKELAQMQLASERKIEALIGTETQIAEQKALLLKISLTQQQEIQKRFFEAEKAEAQKTSDKIKQLKLDEANFLNALEEDKKAKRLAAAAGTLSFLTTIAGGIADMNEKDADKQRKAQIAQARIQAFQAALSAYTSTAAIPIVGAVLAPIAAAAALVFGLKKVDQMQNVKKARRGAVLRGPSHAQGGIPIEAEGDEIILTAGVYRDPTGRAMASDLNARYGGIRFMQSGGPVNPLSAQSVAATASGVTVGAAIPSGDESMELLRVIAEGVLAFPSQLQVNNNVQDTDKGIQVINDLEDDASF